MDCNLYELISKKSQIVTEEKAKSLFWQICKAMEFFHGKGIFHRDIKPENILVKEGLVKIGDFGSCRGIYSKQPFTEYIATRWYRSPECLLCDGMYNFKMDIWGAGCVLFEMVSRSPLFPGADELDQLHRIHNIVGTPSQKVLRHMLGHRSTSLKYNFPPKEGTGFRHLIPNISDTCVDLIKSMLVYDPDKRTTSSDALKHSFFDNVVLPETGMQKDGTKSEPPARREKKHSIKHIEAVEEASSVDKRREEHHNASEKHHTVPEKHHNVPEKQISEPKKVVVHDVQEKKEKVRVDYSQAADSATMEKKEKVPTDERQYVEHNKVTESKMHSDYMYKKSINEQYQHYNKHQMPSIIPNHHTTSKHQSHHVHQEYPQKSKHAESNEPSIKASETVKAQSKSYHYHHQQQQQPSDSYLHYQVPKNKYKIKHINSQHQKHEAASQYPPAQKQAAAAAQYLTYSTLRNPPGGGGNELYQTGYRKALRRANAGPEKRAGYPESKWQSSFGVVGKPAGAQLPGISNVRGGHPHQQSHVKNDNNNNNLFLPPLNDTNHSTRRRY
ncbi:MAG: hypothetical protein SGCHY_001828 [Lobulomycetales sp.]